MSDNLPLGFSVTILGVFVLGGLGLSLASNAHEEHQTCTITAKESVSKGDSGHEYRVFTKECGVLKAKDNLWRGHFDSADTYGSLNIGTKYDLTTTGWRVPILSWMPNIVAATPTQ